MEQFGPDKSILQRYVTPDDCNAAIVRGAEYAWKSNQALDGSASCMPGTLLLSRTIIHQCLSRTFSRAIPNFLRIAILQQE